MCGIAGYIGKDKASSNLIRILSDIEYRGYDSAGIVVQDGGKLEVRKGCGFLKDVAKRLAMQDMSGNIGIGHVRWATQQQSPTTGLSLPDQDTDQYALPFPIPA